MKAVIQRVSGAKVEVDGSVVGSINKGLLVLLGVEKGDTENDIAYISKKIANLRIFEDSDLKDEPFCKRYIRRDTRCIAVHPAGRLRKGKQAILCRCGRAGEGKRDVYEGCRKFAAGGYFNHTGQFAAHMQVHLINNGPVTILLDSRK